MNSFTIALKTEDGKHLYEQIYDYIKYEIREGKLLYQEKLPSTRALAQHLQVSRSTVDLAYEQLLSEGYIESKPYKGYFVCKIEGLYRLETGRHSQPIFKENGTNQYKADFSPHEIAMEEFPFDTWRKITKRVLSSSEKELFSLGSPQGDYELRNTISRYLHSSRGVNCTPEQIVVGAGNDYLLMLLQKMLGKNRSVAIENPTYKRAYRMFQSFDYQINTISLDHAGMKMEELKECKAEIAYVMPSHQYPTGIVMPIGRRMELLNWAAEVPGRYLIEDDYDSEFRYKGKPVPSLQASDHQGKVIYIGTFSKSIAPAIRISYMVLPEDLLKFYQMKCDFLASTVSRIDQSILNHFIADGYYERYLNKMRKIYKSKHDLLLGCLKGFEKKFLITGEHGGLHLILTNLGDETEEELIESAFRQNVKVYGMKQARITEEREWNGPASILIGYGGLPEDKILEGIVALRNAWL